MEIMAIIACIVIGAAAGFCGGLLGLSGGAIAIPGLVLLFHSMGFPQQYLMHSAVGTSLAAMSISGIASTAAHHKQGAIMWDLVISALPGILLGCLLGSCIAHFLPSRLLQVLFGLFVCTLGIYGLIQKNKPKQARRPDKALFTWIGLGIGTLASMLGIGGGVFTIPLLTAYRYPTRQAVGSSAAIGCIITFFAAIAYLYFGMSQVDLPWHIGYIYLPAFATVGLVAIFFARLGARVASGINSTQLKRIFTASLILVGLLMIVS